MNATGWILGIAWTFDHVTELVGAVLAGFAAIGGGLAARYARAGNRRAEATWSAQIRPGVTFVAQTRTPDQPYMVVTITNAGGAVRPGFLAVSDQWSVLAGRYNVPEHTLSYEIRLPVVRVFSQHRETFSVLFHIARDISGSWWDAARGIPLTEAVPDPGEPDEFQSWCSDHWHRQLATLTGTEGADL
jgi:hypothetical protein